MQPFGSYALGTFNKFSDLDIVLCTFGNIMDDNIDDEPSKNLHKPKTGYLEHDGRFFSQFFEFL